MAASLDALEILAKGKRNATNPAGDIAARLQQEQDAKDMQRNLELAAGSPRGIPSSVPLSAPGGPALPTSVSGATPSDLFDAKATLNESPSFGLDEEKRQQTEQDALDFLRPNISAARNADTAAKVAVSAAPNEASARATIETEKLKAANALELQKGERAQQDKMLEYLGMGGGLAGATGTAPQMKPAMDAKGRVSLSTIATPPQQLSQQHGAAIGLTEIPKMRAIVDTLEKHGALGPVMGRMGSAAVGTGLDKVFMSPEAATAFNDFKNQASLMKSNMAMVHGGARGGSNIGMAQRFDQLVNTAQTPAALRGAMDTFERWLTQYAGAKSSADLDAADAALGIPVDHPADMTDPNRGM